MKLAAAKLRKREQVDIWDHCSKVSWSNYPEILIFCKVPEVSVPDYGLSMFYIFLLDLPYFKL